MKLNDVLKALETLNVDKSATITIDINDNGEVTGLNINPSSKNSSLINQPYVALRNPTTDDTESRDMYSRLVTSHNKSIENVTI